MLNVKDNKIADVILSIWNDHYVPTDYLFDTEYLVKKKGSKERMISILEAQDTKQISLMLLTPKEAALWFEFCISAETYAEEKHNEEYRDMCSELARALLSLHKGRKWPNIPSTKDDWDQI